MRGLLLERKSTICVLTVYDGLGLDLTGICNGAELGGATGAMAPLVFWSRSLEKSQKVSKSKSRSLEWHQLFLPSFGANVH